MDARDQTTRSKVRSILPLAAALLLSIIAYAFFYSRAPSDPVFQFFCARGAYQHANVFLIFYGLILVARKWRGFALERDSLTLSDPERKITPEDAAVLAKRIPDGSRNTLLGRRFDELFRGFSRQEEIGTLIDRLANKDREELERSYTLLSWIRTLPPIVGLLGTLDGLRGGTRELAELSGAASLPAIRQALQAFAFSSSTAFDTTLLGIAGALLLSALIFAVQRRETDHINEVDRRAENLTRWFQGASRIEEALQQIAHSFGANFIRQLDASLDRASRQLAEIIREPRPSSDGDGVSRHG